MAQWNDRLLPAARALEMAGDWPLTATHEYADLGQFENEAGRPPLESQWQINLRCSTVKGWKLDDPDGSALLPRVACEQSVGMLAAKDQSFTTSISDLLAGVVRHMVTAHNLSLSGTRNDHQAQGGP
jgi:hypothetical protein